MNDIDALIGDFATRIRSKQDMPILHRPFHADRAENTPPDRAVERPLAPEVINHAGLIVDGAITRALAKIKHYGRTATAGFIRDALVSSIQEHCASVITAAKAHAQMLRADKRHKEKRVKARAQLAAELKDARRRLRKLRNTITDTEQGLDRMVSERIQSAKAFYAKNLAVCDEGYPAIPPASIYPDKEGTGLPLTPGIYFIWEGDAVVYVGQSIRLGQRLRLGGHNILKPSHQISYLEIEPYFLTFAECYYIGVLRPFENFGNSASHRNYPIPKECPPVLEATALNG